MKRLFLLTSLLLSANAWAEDEFPIELTCEVGDEVWYFHLEKEMQDSWFMPHQANPERTGRNFEDFKGKKNKFYFDYEMASNTIKIIVGRWNSINIYINRYTLKLMQHGYGGQCYKGFKEYEKQI